MATITGIAGKQYPIGTQEYEERKYQYATSSYEGEKRMEPGLIIYPHNKGDIANCPQVRQIPENCRGNQDRRPPVQWGIIYFRTQHSARLEEDL